MMEWIITSSAMILIIIALRGLLKGKISLRLQYALWALVLVRLLLPFSVVESAISVSNWLTASVVREADAAVEEYQKSLDAVWVEFSQSGETLPQQELEQQVQQELYDRTYETLEREYTQSGQAVPSQQIETEAKQQVKTISRTVAVMELLPWIWAGGMAFMAVVLLISNLHFAKKLRRSRTTMEISGVPLRVYLTNCVATPCLFGLVKPCIYLTEETASDETMQRHVIAHELSHYRERDHIWSVLRCLCLVLHWYNPLVWWAAVLSKRDAELSCDERTIRALGEEQRTAYGRTLIGMTCVQRDPKALMLTATTMLGTQKALKERIKLIAQKPKAALYTIVACLLVAAVAVGCTFTGAPGEVKEPTEVTDPAEPSAEDTEPLDFADLSEEDLLQRCREAVEYVHNLENFQIAERQSVARESDKEMLSWDTARYLHTGDDWFHSFIIDNYVVKFLEKDGTLWKKTEITHPDPEVYSDWSEAVPADPYAEHCWIMDMGWNEDGTIYRRMPNGAEVTWEVLSVSREEARNREIIHLKLSRRGEEPVWSDVLSFRFDTTTGKVIGIDRVVESGEFGLTDELIITVAKAEDVQAIIDACWREITGEEPDQTDETDLEGPDRVRLHGVLDLEGMVYGGAPEDYYWFVYHPEADHMPPEGKDTDGKTYALTPGYLYTQHGETGVVYPVLEEQVVGLYVTERYLFSLTESNSIIVTDMTGQLKQELYRGTEPIQPVSLGYWDGTLYFVEGSSVRNLDLTTGNVGLLTIYEGAVDADPVYNVADKYPHLLHLRTETEDIACNLLIGETAALDTDAKLERFLEDGTWPVEQKLTVEYFTQLLTSSKGYWYHRIMGCIFEDPSEISLEHMFYTGMELIHAQNDDGDYTIVMNQRPYEDSFSSDEAAFLQEYLTEQYGDMASAFDANKLPRKRVESVLQACLGITLEDAEIPERWTYFEESDAYYDFRSDAYILSGQKVMDVVVSSDGTIYVYWAAPDIWDAVNGTSIKNPQMVMTLRRNHDGSFRVLSNLPEN